MSEPIAWTKFKDLLYDYYFSNMVKDDKETEFLHLMQGNPSVVQYERKFTKLSCFTPDLVGTSKWKVKRFIRGPCKEIRGSVVLKEPTTFAKALRDDLVMDKNVSKKAQPHLQNGSSSGIKRNCESSPP